MSILCNRVVRGVRDGFYDTPENMAKAILELASLVDGKPEDNLSVAARILNECMVVFGTSKSFMMGKGRLPSACDARHSAIALMRAHGMTVKEISAAIGFRVGRVGGAIRSVRARIETEPKFRKRFIEIANATGVVIPTDWIEV